MRLLKLKLSTWMLLGGAALLAQHRRRQATRAIAPDEADRMTDNFAADPNDPVQGFDEAAELRVDPLAVDVMSTADAEAAQDLAALETDLDRRGLAFDSYPVPDDIDAATVGTDTGDLYGVHAVATVDTNLPDDRTAMNEGQNWIEALETSAAENGADPETELEIDDEYDNPPHPTDTRDIPVADRGSAGPGGL
ncbi:MAG: hypothetical protein H0T89_34820 [Deltaproteobacteria bacterium]|nr:hypothetical protein [Deltaproteobacteria bacterium]MDQ3296181.1 hypothetical protein [Myxococcota bacterium]